MSFPEMAVLLVVGLLVLGPRELPRVARRLGGWVGRARRTARELRYQLEREIALADVAKPRAPNHGPSHEPDGGSGAPKGNADEPPGT